MNKRDFFQENGYVVVEDLIPDNVIETYREYWISKHAPQYDGTVASMDNKMGWKESNPFINHKLILEILCHDNVYDLFNEIELKKMAVHLSFTSWYSTEKSWHHDYSSEDNFSAKNYVGLWVALQDIDSSSGPFAIVPGSHNSDFDFSIYKNLNPEQIALHIENTLRNEARAKIFLPRKGGALLWQGHALHRGLNPLDTNIPRESIIGHYISGVNGKGSDQVNNFKSYRGGFYLKHKNQISNLFNTDTYGNRILGEYN